MLSEIEYDEQFDRELEELFQRNSEWVNLEEEKKMMEEEWIF